MPFLGARCRSVSPSGGIARGRMSPDMTKVGHAANRLSEAQLEKFHEWLRSLQFPDGGEGRKVSQATIGAMTGTGQTFIQGLLAGKHTTVGTARSMMLKAGANPAIVFGTEAAKGRYEALDEMTNRGQVLDALSSIYDEEFLMACQAMTPPPGSDSWTHHKWTSYLVSMRDMWDSGHMRAKNGTPRKA